MDLTQAGFLTFGASDHSVPWLDVCPPLQPGSLNSAFAVAATPVVDGRPQDRGPSRAAPTSDGPMQHAGLESDGADFVSHRERLEMLHAAAAAGIGECPTWFILAIEKEPIGPAI